MSRTLDLSIADGVATIVLDRPRRMNALDLVLRGELADAVAAVQRDPAVHAVILTGAGGNFCSGGDIATMAATTATRTRAGSARSTCIRWSRPCCSSTGR